MISWEKKFVFSLMCTMNAKAYFYNGKKNLLTDWQSFHPTNMPKTFITPQGFAPAVPSVRTLSPRIIACLGPSSSSGAGSNITPESFPDQTRSYSPQPPSPPTHNQSWLFNYQISFLQSMYYHLTR